MDGARNSWFRDATTEVYNNFTIFPNYLPLHMWVNKKNFKLQIVVDSWVKQ